MGCRSRRNRVIDRVRAWAAQWGPIAPLLLAELTIWIGFGALLPILPIYFTQHGVDIRTLGLVVAAWPAARLLGEPIFGWLADRVARRPLMITGLVLASGFAVLPLFAVGPAAFVVCRALSGLAAPMYDPPPAFRRVPAGAGPRVVDVRPRRTRVPRRRQPARAAGRGVRDLRVGADRRLHDRARDRRNCRGAHRAADRRVLDRRDHAVHLGCARRVARAGAPARRAGQGGRRNG